MRVSCFTTCRGCENGCVQDLPAAAGAVAKLDATVERLPVPLTDDPAFLAIFLELSTAKDTRLEVALVDETHGHCDPKAGGVNESQR